MKALYIGSLDPNSCAVFYRNSLKDLGYDVVSHDPEYFSNQTFLEKLVLKVTKEPLRSKIAKSDKKLLELAKTHAFDLVLVIAENFLSTETIEEFKSLQKNSKPIFIYHSHDNNFSSGILKPRGFWETLKYYDYAFTTKSQNVKKYEELGQKNAFFIPSAFSPHAHRLVLAAESQFIHNPLEVSFIGTYDKSRDPVFDTLDWKHLNIWGNNWKRSKHFTSHSDRIVPHAIYGKLYADVTSHSKISLGLLREEAEDLHTQRTFEIPACGSMQIAPRNDEILSFFDEDKEIVCYGTLEELKDKIDYYLKHETERAKIARNGYEKVMHSQHTYTDRVLVMVSKTGQL